MHFHVSSLLNLFRLELEPGVPWLEPGVLELEPGVFWHESGVLCLEPEVLRNSESLEDAIFSLSTR